MLPCFCIPVLCTWKTQYRCTQRENSLVSLKSIVFVSRSNNFFITETSLLKPISFTLAGLLWTLFLVSPGSLLILKASFDKSLINNHSLNHQKLILCSCTFNGWDQHTVCCFELGGIVSRVLPLPNANMPLQPSDCSWSLTGNGLFLSLHVLPLKWGLDTCSHDTHSVTVFKLMKHHNWTGV